MKKLLMIISVIAIITSCEKGSDSFSDNGYYPSYYGEKNVWVTYTNNDHGIAFTEEDESTYIPGDLVVVKFKTDEDYFCTNIEIVSGNVYSFKTYSHISEGRLVYDNECQFIFTGDKVHIHFTFGEDPKPEPKPEEPKFNKEFLYSGSGEWSFTADYGNGPNELRHKFNSNGSGWEKNITLEQKEQKFTWSLTGSRLTFLHNIATGGVAPEDCTVTTLSETRLVYKTENGTTISCTKLP